MTSATSRAQAWGGKVLLSIPNTSMMLGPGQTSIA